jgi:hypothetical protein
LQMTAIQLVQYQPDTGKLVVPDQAEQALRHIDKPVAIVGIAGRYRSGKSTLISRLINRSDAFEVGHSISSCTKGILLHEAPPRSAEQSQAVLVLDSEGLNALDSNIEHDVRIFALSVLLSSVFVYNVQGTIDETTLSSLKVVVDFVRLVQDAPAEMPAFAVVVRDFALKLQQQDGRELTPDQWLEDTLAPTGDQCQEPDKAEVRRTVRELFPQRRCFTLPRPSADEGVLSRMDTVDECELRPEFVQALTGLRESLIRDAPVKTILGEPLTGAGLCRVAKLLVKAINASEAPPIRESWALLAHMRRQDAVQRALRGMHQATAQWAHTDMTLAELLKALDGIRRDTRHKATGGDDQGFDRAQLAQLDKDLDDRVEEIISDARRVHRERLDQSIRHAVDGLSEEQDLEAFEHAREAAGAAVARWTRATGDPNGQWYLDAAMFVPLLEAARRWGSPLHMQRTQPLIDDLNTRLEDALSKLTAAEQRSAELECTVAELERTVAEQRAATAQPPATPVEDEVVPPAPSAEITGYIQAQVEESRQHAERCIQAKQGELDAARAQAREEASQHAEALFKAEETASDLRRQLCESNARLDAHVVANAAAHRRELSELATKCQHDILDQTTKLHLQITEERGKRAEAETHLARLNSANEAERATKRIRADLDTSRMDNTRLHAESGMLRQQLVDSRKAFGEATERCSSLEHENIRLRHDLFLNKLTLQTE